MDIGAAGGTGATGASCAGGAIPGAAGAGGMAVKDRRGGAGDESEASGTGETMTGASGIE